MRCIVLFLSLSLLALTPSPPDTLGCASVPHKEERVDVNAEEAIIVYDAATRTEHFIRRANFRTEAKDFGFLVPTPTKPELGETASRVFDTLQHATAPRRVASGNVVRIVTKRSDVDKTANAPKSRPPEILDQKRVAGYDAVVLRAHDTEGLKKWLEDNQYNARPAVIDWLKWYVENQWIITAFKVAMDGNAGNDRWAMSVRMSFETDAPFYPYREPEDVRTRQPQDLRTYPRKLRVYFLADARYRGKLGSDGAWAGRTVWSNVCPGGTLTSVVQGLGMQTNERESLGAKTWHLTEFEDDSTPRPGTNEVYFRRAEDQATVERPVIYYDHYEYVAEEEGILDRLVNPSAPAQPSRTESGGAHWWQIGLILGGVAVGVVFAAMLFLVLRKKQRPR